MSKKYTPKQFSPHVYQEWGELYKICNSEQLKELLIAITQYPNYTPNDCPIWSFIKSQIDKDYNEFLNRCEAHREAIQNYWGTKENKDNHNDMNEGFGEQMLSNGNTEEQSETNEVDNLTEDNKGEQTFPLVKQKTTEENKGEQTFPLVKQKTTEENKGEQRGTKGNL
jgi:hypothetical protein